MRTDLTLYLGKTILNQTVQTTVFIAQEDTDFPGLSTVSKQCAPGIHPEQTGTAEPTGKEKNVYYQNANNVPQHEKRLQEVLRTLSTYSKLSS